VIYSRRAYAVRDSRGPLVESLILTFRTYRPGAGNMRPNPSGRTLSGQSTSIGSNKKIRNKKGKTMRHIVVVCTLLASLFGRAATAQRTMTSEEATVRTVYAKLSYAVDLETAIRAVRHNPKITYAQLTQEVAKESLTFHLSDFSVGDISSVLDQKYSQVFHDIRDGGNVIDITSVTETFTEENKPGVKTETSMNVAQPRWSHGPQGPVPDLTVAEALPIMERESGISALMRYCTYTVTVAFEGRSRTYQTQFFFGPEGQGEVNPGDMVVALGGGMLQELLVKPVYPQVLLKTDTYGKNPALREFLEVNQRSNATCQRGEACCDLSALQCGVYSSDLKGGIQ
jgi:hypothetical protein